MNRTALARIPAPVSALTSAIAFAAVLTTAAMPAAAQEAPHALGQHPAVIVAARQAADYDYASKFYRHPAGLDLRSEEPSANRQHPAVQVAEGRGRQGVDANTFIVGHPASPSWHDEPDAPMAVAAVTAAR